MLPYQLRSLGTPKRHPTVITVGITKTIGFYPATWALSSKLKYLQNFSISPPLDSASHTFLPLFNDSLVSFSKKYSYSIILLIFANVRDFYL